MSNARTCALAMLLSALLLSACNSDGTLAEPSADADASVSARKEELVLPPPPRCTSRAPNCGCGKVPLCLIGSSWTCVTIPEQCNGLDDNCDGQIDEGGGSLCDDGRECTTDLCANRFDGTKTCYNLPAHRLCGDGASCTLDQCFAAGSTVPAGFSPPDERGCSSKPIDDRCDDGCHCTGMEICDPARTGASRSRPGSGCVLGTPPCERDGRFCTVEWCCETGENCEIPAGARVAIDFTCSFSSFDPRTSGTGESLRCPRGSRGPVTSPVSCDDNNPCTADFCDEGGDRCGHTPLNGDVEGCGGTADEGCTRLSCVNGACTGRERSSPSDGFPYPCTGTDGDTCYFKTCISDRSRPGRGRCNRVPQHDVCQDASVFCMSEVCTSLDDPTLQFFQVPGKPRGCVYQGDTCNDGDDCTRDRCNDSTDSCSHQSICGPGPF